MLKKENLKLMIPTMDWEKEIREFRREFIVNGGDMDGCLSLKTMENISDWIQQVESFSSKETCPEGFVPQTQYILMREEDHKVIGVIQIRHYLNDFLEKYGGHIGYSVCHSERKKGHANQMLKSILPECKNLGLKRILITCLEENRASEQVIINNGGLYESTVYEPIGRVKLKRFWIELMNERL